MAPWFPLTLALLVPAQDTTKPVQRPLPADIAAEDGGTQEETAVDAGQQDPQALEAARAERLAALETTTALLAELDTAITQGEQDVVEQVEMAQYQLAQVAESAKVWGECDTLARADSARRALDRVTEAVQSRDPLNARLQLRFATEIVRDVRSSEIVRDMRRK
jgi:hypothetical protein